jgi:hypothetical protein
MRRFVFAIALFFCVCGISPRTRGQTQPTPQTPVTGQQPPAPKPALPTQQPVVVGWQPIYGQPQQPQAPAAPTQPPVTMYAANPGILQQYGVQTPIPVQQVAYAAPTVYGMTGPPLVAAGPALTTNGSLSLGGGPIAQWLVQRVGKTHTWTWNHTVTRPTVTPAVPVSGPTSYVATMPAPQPVQMMQPVLQTTPVQYFQQVTQYQPTIAYQPVTSFQPVAPPVQYAPPPVQQQPPPTAPPPCPPTKRDEDAPAPPRASSQIPPPRHLFGK